MIKIHRQFCFFEQCDWGQPWTEWERRTELRVECNNRFPVASAQAGYSGAIQWNNSLITHLETKPSGSGFSSRVRGLLLSKKLPSHLDSSSTHNALSGWLKRDGGFYWGAMCSIAVLPRSQSSDQLHLSSKQHKHILFISHEILMCVMKGFKYCVCLFWSRHTVF